MFGCASQPPSLTDINHVDQLEDVNYIDGYGKSLVHVAAEEGNSELIRELAERGADLNAMNVRGEVALSLAILNQHRGTAQLLIQEGADVSATGAWLTPIAAAIRVDDQQTASTLLRLGADVHAMGRGGETPLFLAAFFGRLAIVEQLIEHGADVDERTKDDRTPLHAAVLGSHPEAAERLLGAGAVVVETDKSEQALLGTAYLYEYMANRDVDGQNPNLVPYYYTKAAEYYKLCAIRFDKIAKKYTAKALVNLILGAAYAVGSTYSAEYNAAVGAEAHGIGFGFIDYGPVVSADSLVTKNMTVQSFYREVAKRCEEKSEKIEQLAKTLAGTGTIPEAAEPSTQDSVEVPPELAKVVVYRPFKGAGVGGAICVRIDGEKEHLLKVNQYCTFTIQKGPHVLWMNFYEIRIDPRGEQEWPVFSYRFELDDQKEYYLETISGISNFKTQFVEKDKAEQTLRKYTQGEPQENPVHSFPTLLYAY
jgi:ankyrin repeat protein